MMICWIFKFYDLIKLLKEPTFTEPLKNGDLVDISPDAVDPRIYIQLEADVQNQDNLNMIHVKQCKVCSKWILAYKKYFII